LRTSLKDFSSLFFHLPQIRALFPLVEEVLTRFTKYICEQLRKDTNEPLDAREICAKFTTDVVSSCIFNADAQSFTTEKPPIREMGRKMMTFDDKLLIAKFMLYSVFPSLSKIWKFRFVSKEIENFFVDLMKQALELREKTKINRDDYLAHLITLRNKKQISELDIAAHGVTFFIDGFETSSLAICYALFEVRI
jgi:cytochrome P450